MTLTPEGEQFIGMIAMNASRRCDLAHCRIMSYLSEIHPFRLHMTHQNLTTLETAHYQADLAPIDQTVLYDAAHHLGVWMRQLHTVHYAHQIFTLEEWEIP